MSSETALERLARLSADQVQLAAVERVSSYTRRTKTGQAERVRQYERRGQVGIGMGAKKGIFNNAPAAPSVREIKNKPVPVTRKAPAKVSAPKAAPKANRQHHDVPSPAREKPARQSKAPADSTPVHLDDEETAKIIKRGYKLDPKSRQELLDASGVSVKHKDLDPAEMFDRWRTATSPAEKAELAADMHNLNTMAAMYQAMLDHAEKESKIEETKARIQQRGHDKFDGVLARFGKPGQALIRARERLIESTVNQKVIEPAVKGVEKSKELIKDVGWRIAEGALATSFLTHTIAAAHILGSFGGDEHLAEAVHHLTEGRVAEAVIGATVSLGMALALRVARKSATKAVKKAVKKRKDAKQAQLSGDDDALLKLASVVHVPAHTRRGPSGREQHVESYSYTRGGGSFSSGVAAARTAGYARFRDQQAKLNAAVGGGGRTYTQDDANSVAATLRAVEAPHSTTWDDVQHEWADGDGTENRYVSDVGEIRRNQGGNYDAYSKLNGDLLGSYGHPAQAAKTVENLDEHLNSAFGTKTEDLQALRKRRPRPNTPANWLQDLMYDPQAPTTTW